jgi:hypothetical protein
MSGMGFETVSSATGLLGPPFGRVGFVGDREERVAAALRVGGTGLPGSASQMSGLSPAT